MKNQVDNIPVHYLYPAALFNSKEAFYIHTILGSCVAVCLYDPIMKIGGMNHFMLPLWNGQGLASPKYGNIAIEKLIERVTGMGSLKKNLKAKVFGGGEVIDTHSASFQIGLRNINLAVDLLEQYRIPIISSSLGGKYGRKIQFATHTGEVRMKYVQRTVNVK